MRVDQVSLNLLQHQKQHQKPHRLHRIYHHDQKHSDDTADKCAENRNQRRYRNHDSGQHCIRHPQNRHGNDKQGAENHRLHALPGQKTGKHLIGQSCHRENLLRGLLRKDCVQNLFCLSRQTLLLEQHIDGKRKRNHKRHHTAHDPGKNTNAGAHNPRRKILHKRHNRVGKRRPVNIKLRHRRGKCRIAVRKICQPLLYGFYRNRNLLYNHGNRISKLRYHDHKCQRDNTDHKRKRQQIGNGSSPFCKLPVLRKQMPLDTLHRNIDHECDRASNQKRHHNPQHKIHRSDHHVKMLHPAIEQNPKCNDLHHPFPRLL